jgi:predicted tellurium resistance membrane protein TerC
MELLFDPQAWIALVTLTVLEIVLGIDNIIFISILSDKLPAEKRARARSLGLTLAMFTRVGLLFSLSVIMQLTEPFFTILGKGISGRDLILIGGGLFLIAKSTHEIHQKLEGDEGEKGRTIKPNFGAVIFQIVLIDIVFSLDSVITAVGMSNHLSIMVTAVILAVGFMLWLSGSVNKFVNDHPTVKMLALSFLLLIGVTLIAEGLGQHVSKGYIYFAMSFSVFVEMLNIRLQKKRKPLHLRSTIVDK